MTKGPFAESNGINALQATGGDAKRPNFILYD
jgi:hypothetical protein